MKKTIAALLCAFCLLFTYAIADVGISGSEEALAANTAAAEFGGLCAAFAEDSNTLYYVKEYNNAFCIESSVSGLNPTMLTELPAGFSYPSITAGSDGSVFVIKQDADSEERSALLYIVPSDDGCFASEFLFAGKTSFLKPYGVFYSEDIGSGCIFFKLSLGGQSLNTFSVFDIFWGSVSSYDTLMFINTETETVEAFESDTLFDLNGAALDSAGVLLNRIKSGSLLAADDLSLSPDGSILLLKCGLNDEQRFFAVDIYSLKIHEIGVPAESGCLSWSGDSLLVFTTDDGTASFIDISDVRQDSYFGWPDDDLWGDDFEGESLIFGDDASSGWDDVEDGDLGEWE